MSSKLDKVDLKIIKSLKSDARQPITQLAKDVGISRPTVINRLKKLTSEDILRFSVGINLKKLESHMACITLEVKGDDLRQEAIRSLSKCPRVLMLLQMTQKANLMILLFGEDQNTLRSTMESFRDFTGSSIIDVYHSEPLFPEAFSFDLYEEKSNITPCGKNCGDCSRYQNELCIGCPVVIEYKGPL